MAQNVSARFIAKMEVALTCIYIGQNIWKFIFVWKSENVSGISKKKILGSKLQGSVINENMFEMEKVDKAESGET